MKGREDFLPRLVALMGGRPVRWAASPQTIGDYDGRERTLEVFNADSVEQRDLLRRLRPIRSEIEPIVGGAVIVIFHTRSESERLYGEFIASHIGTPLRAVAE
jgi:hypothetical protein